MKKLFVCMGALVLASGMAFAQKSNVNKAKNLLIAEPVDFNGARSAIEAAKTNPETEADPNTWYIAGRIGYTQEDKEYNKQYLGQATDPQVMAEGLVEMFTNYLMAESLDGKVLDKKGNPKYVTRKKIKGDFKEKRDQYVMVASMLWEQQNYAKAYELFDMYCQICDLDMFTEKDGVKVDTLYNERKFYSGLAAMKAEMNDKAIEVFESLKPVVNDNQETVYQCLTMIFYNAEDTTRYLAILDEGVRQFPASNYFAGNLINYYVAEKKYDEAIDYLDGLIASDPSNVDYVTLKSELLVQIKKYDEAKELLAAAKAENPGNPSIDFYLGRTWAFEGDYISDEADNLKDNKAYKAAKAQATENYKKGVEYLEKARAMGSENSRYEDLLQNLKVLYYRLGEYDKSNAVKAEIDALNK